jgi:DNA-binding NtrC family response regulator
MVQTTAYDLILTDIYMPEGPASRSCTAKENDPHVQVIVVTGSATLDNAVEALNMGAFSYLSKPFDHMSVFDNAVSRPWSSAG